MGFGEAPGKVTPRMPLRHGEGSKDHHHSLPAHNTIMQI